MPGAGKSIGPGAMPVKVARAKLPDVAAAVDPGGEAVTAAVEARLHYYFGGRDNIIIPSF